MKTNICKCVILVCFCCYNNKYLFGRNYMRKSIIALFLFCMALCVHAVQLNSLQNVSGNFTQTKHITKLNRNLVSSGTFIIAEGKGIVWNTVKPIPSTATVGKDYIMQIMPDGKKNRMNASGNATFAEISAALTSLFSGDMSSLYQNFEVQETALQDGSWQLELSPKFASLKQAIQHITVSGATYINTVVLTEPDTNTITYTFSEQKAFKALSSEQAAYFEY